MSNNQSYYFCQSSFTWMTCSRIWSLMDVTLLPELSKESVLTVLAYFYIQSFFPQKIKKWDASNRCSKRSSRKAVALQLFLNYSQLGKNSNFIKMMMICFKTFCFHQKRGRTENVAPHFAQMKWREWVCKCAREIVCVCGQVGWCVWVWEIENVRGWV